jgi:protein transport protein SEC61 subunit beta
MVKSDSNTNVGAGGGKSKALATRGPPGRGAVNRRPAGKKTSNGAGSGGTAGTGGQWRFYTEDSPGLKVGPVPVLVLSLLFIASVFMLHIWGKFSRA